MFTIQALFLISQMLSTSGAHNNKSASRFIIILIFLFGYKRKQYKQ